MPELSIDDKSVSVPKGSTVLDAATKLGLSIPTMCHLKDSKAFTSCMVCVVKNANTGCLIPACSALAEDGMIITTDCDEVTDARQTALELLFSEHIGDCEGPCQRVCPANIDIPNIIRCISTNDIPAAQMILSNAVPSGDPCAECDCRCEKACRRRQHDSAVSIKLLIKLLVESRPTETSYSSSNEPAKRFNCSIGRLIDGEMDEFLSSADRSPRIEPVTESFTIEEAQKESKRCLRCDCRKADTCLLRQYADTYQAQQRRYKPEARNAFQQVRQHASVIFEPGKCIKCGICVRITETHREELGLTFIGRGFDLRIDAPFGEPLNKALTKAASDCVTSCPTAALAYMDAS